MSRSRRVSKKKESPDPEILMVNTSDTPQIFETIPTPLLPITREELQNLIKEAPELPPLPPDAINFIEFRFRPKYKEFLEKLRKIA